MDLSKSVIMPQEDFHELTAVAFGQTTSTGERVASILQTFLVCGSLAGSFIVATRAWTKSMKQLEDVKTANKILEAEELHKIQNQQ